MGIRNGVIDRKREIDNWVTETRENSMSKTQPRKGEKASRSRPRFLVIRTFRRDNRVWGIGGFAVFHSA